MDTDAYYWVGYMSSTLRLLAEEGNEQAIRTLQAFLDSDFPSMQRSEIRQAILKGAVSNIEVRT